MQATTPLPPLRGEPLRRRARASALWASAALALLSLSCARTALTPRCPQGYAPDGTTCVCVTDQGCPVGMSCEEGLCVCRDTACCPKGYEYAPASAACVCRSEACCPAGHGFSEPDQRCECRASDCCPPAYAYDAVAKACRCVAESCCPIGFSFDPKGARCVCDSDLCCPIEVFDGGTGPIRVAYQFDALRKDCVCAGDACCPADYRYKPQIRACVCSGSSCCPDGWAFQNGRCECTPSGCPANTYCDAASGACRCLNSAGCPRGQYCNALGFCQAAFGCTSNIECPPDTFCDVTSDVCLPSGPCTLDEHCAFGQICDVAQAKCRSGCRRDADCPLKQACVNGACAPFCRESASCPVNQFCNPTTGSCATRAGRVDCADCTANAVACGAPTAASCLAFVAEGQTARFCGMHCAAPADCPSGYDCTGVINTCSGEGSICQGDPNAPGEAMICKGFLVENEVGTQYFCADSTGQPHVYLRACAPSSGFCPASASP